MEAWWTAMDIMTKTVWIVAIITSLIFVIQMIMTFVGMDSNADFSGEVGDTSMGDAGSFPFQLFTFRNFINFFLGFSWSYIVFYDLVSSVAWVIVISVFVGLLVVAGVMMIFYSMSRMTESGNIHIEQTIGSTAHVYIPIPGNREGRGKIQLSIQSSIREYDAITAGEALKTGNIVKVIEVVEGSILLVEKI